MKNILIALGALLGLLFLAGIAIVSLVDVNAHKPRIEAAVSDALGMEFRIQGKAGLHLFPSASISLSDIRLRNLGTDLAAAETIRMGVRLLPLLRRQVKITEFILEKPVIRIEKLADGKFNIETPPRSTKPSVKGGEGPGASLAVAGGAVRNGTVIYLDRKGGGENGDLRDRLLLEEPLPPGSPGHAAAEGNLLCRGAAGEGYQGKGPRPDRPGCEDHRIRRRL